jgi:hypothetical protein
MSFYFSLSKGDWRRWVFVLGNIRAMTLSAYLSGYTGRVCGTPFYRLENVPKRMHTSSSLLTTLHLEFHSLTQNSTEFLKELMVLTLFKVKQ